MKLRTPPTGAPRRTPCGAAGSDLGSILRSLSRLAGDSVSPVMSLTCAERSRTTPCASTRPGFSAPGAPNRTSFMGLPSWVLRVPRRARQEACLSGRLSAAEVKGPRCSRRGCGGAPARGDAGERAAADVAQNRTTACAQVGDKCAAMRIIAAQTAACRAEPELSSELRRLSAVASEEVHHDIDAGTDDRCRGAR